MLDYLYKTVYISVMIKNLKFIGRSIEDLRDFSKTVRQEIGTQLRQLQRGIEPNDWKPMPTIGSGVREIRVRDESGAYRVIYVAKFTDAIYVLHVFQKKTQKTEKRDLDLAAKRYRELLQEIRK